MKLSEAVAATFAVVGQDISDLGLAAICSDLKGYHPEAIGTALARCRKELRRIALADILDRIPGQLPGVEEAWAICARSLNDEQCTIVWTQEIAAAFGVALGLRDDPIAARMAFKESYARLKAEAQGKAVQWMPSLGSDPTGREGPLLDAVEKGRLPIAHAQQLLPHLDAVHPKVAALIAPVANAMTVEG